MFLAARWFVPLVIHGVFSASLPKRDPQTPFYDVNDGPTWPMADVGIITVTASDAYPDINLNITHYHAKSCPQSPLEDFVFLNGSKGPATYDDLVSDLETAYTSTGSEDLVAKWLNQRVSELWQIYVLANDTLDWFAVEDLPPGGLLPYPEALESLYSEKHHNQGLFGTVTTTKARRANNGASSSVSIPVREVSSDELEDDYSDATDVPKDLGTIPAANTLAAEAKSSSRRKAWDWALVLVGCGIGGVVQYGGLNVAERVTSIKDNVWAATFFGASGLAIGIITGVLISKVQTALAISAAARARSAKDLVQASQLAGMEIQIQTLKKTVKTIRKKVSREARRALPNPAQVGRVLVKKPVKSLAVKGKELAEATGEGLKKAGEKTFGSLREAFNIEDSAETGMSNGAAGPDTSQQPIPDPNLTAPQMKKVLSSRCAVPEIQPDTTS